MKEGKLLCLTFILFNFLTDTNFTSTTSRKLIFGNEKPVRYSRVFMVTKFDINKLKIQCNLGEMFGNG